MWAAWHNQVPAMRVLVQAGANINAADRYGQSALSLAAENSNGAQEQAVSLLLDYGADASACGYEGKTAAEWAEETVRILLYIARCFMDVKMTLPQGNIKAAQLLHNAPTRHARWMAAVCCPFYSILVYLMWA